MQSWAIVGDLPGKALARASRRLAVHMLSEANRLAYADRDSLFRMSPFAICQEPKPLSPVLPDPRRTGLVLGDH